MVSTKARYYIRALLLITGLVLLCIGGALFIYLLLLGRTPNEGIFIFDLRGRIIMWTLVVIGFIFLLAVFKLSDYSREIEDGRRWDFTPTPNSEGRALYVKTQREILSSTPEESQTHIHTVSQLRRTTTIECTWTTASASSPQRQWSARVGSRFWMKLF